MVASVKDFKVLKYSAHVKINLSDEYESIQFSLNLNRKISEVRSP